METWIQIVGQALADGTFVSLVLSRPTAAHGEREPQTVRVRPVEYRGGLRYQWASRHARQETHENLTVEESVRRLPEVLGRFQRAQLLTTVADFTARADRSGEWGWRRAAACRAVVAQPHNRTKRYLIPEGVPCPFLEAAGVMTASGQVRSPARAKFRQINRYLEFVEDIYRELPAEGVLSVVDFGCGKSSLTFALHHLLTRHHGRDVQVIGLDRNPDVIHTCAQTAARLQLPGIEFRLGDIVSHRTSGPVHLAVSLHACDTATDDALAQAVAWRANVILAVPCCQHEIARTMHAPAALMAHGILKERFAAIVTDALRAAALEMRGYRTQVLEFIDMEHTPKNVLIRAVRRESGAAGPAARERLAQLKQLVGVSRPYIEQVLRLEEAP